MDDILLFFDIDNTLIPTAEFANNARENAVRAMIRMGLKYDEKELMDLLLKTIKNKGSNYDRHFDDMLKSIGIKKSERAKYIAAGVGAYHDTKSAIMSYPEVPQVLMNLKVDGYKLYVATDGLSVKQWDKLIRIGVAILFDGVFTSENLKIGKSKEFYEKIASRLKVRPERCLMVGDRESMDIIPAKKAGWKTILAKRGPYAENVKNSKADAVINDFNELKDKIHEFEMINRKKSKKMNSRKTKNKRKER